ncbi:MAG: hypothetical protein LBD13_06055 [Spirochaetaceae bacterium]|nr:hypothetical protein [Spirochaetaceae bacterium]
MIENESARRGRGVRGGGSGVAVTGGGGKRFIETCGAGGFSGAGAGVASGGGGGRSRAWARKTLGAAPDGGYAGGRAGGGAGASNRAGGAAAASSSVV